MSSPKLLVYSEIHQEIAILTMLYFKQLSISNKPFQLLLLKLWHIINQHLGREMGGRFKREGIYVYRWLIHVEV